VVHTAIIRLQITAVYCIFYQCRIAVMQCLG
jgi:hypothetical protein